MRKWLCLVLAELLLIGCTACVGEPIAQVESSVTLPVTEAEKVTIQAFLNDPTNNGFIGHSYTSPEKISLYAVFHDGAGVGTFGTTEWSEQEKRDVLAAAGWDSYHNPPLKIPRNAVARVLSEKLGLSPEEIETDLSDSFCYLEVYDAYYTMHGDSNYSPVVVTAGRNEPNGTYVIEYTYNSAVEHDGVVTLRKTDAGLQFISNIENRHQGFRRDLN